MSDWALILGSSSGFGAATARELAKGGINIFGIHLDRKAGMDAVNELVDELRSYGVLVEFRNMSATDHEKRQNVIDDLVKMDTVNIKVLLHSLAFGALMPIIDDQDALKQKQIEMTLNVMASSLVYWAQDLFSNNLISSDSHIFAMTSSGGHRQWKSYGAVSAAKAALESYCRQLAFELSEHGISVNALQAGVTDTPALRKIPGNEQMIERAESTNPGKRLTLPTDIAKVIAMIATSNASWMTGNTIRVDGGEDLTG